MSELILDPAYWKRRLRNAPPDQPHQAIFRCPLDTWLRIEEKHRAILASTIGPRESILDAGCGWGRLLTLLPEEWDGRYLGVDLSPDFIGRARLTFPTREFMVCDLREAEPCPDSFDWAVLISIRPMIRRNCEPGTWEKIEFNLRSLVKRILYLEYDVTDGGSIE